MTVYVDALRLYHNNKHWKYGKSCDLYADTLEELHLFAIKLQLKREWFHDHKSLPHYDLNDTKRKLAVDKGAVEHTHRQMIKMLKRMKD